MRKMSCAENYDYIKNRESPLRTKTARRAEKFRAASVQMAPSREEARFRIGFRRALRSAFLNRNAC